MTVHLLDMGADTLAALCGADTPFMVSPGLHRHDRTGVDCDACLVIDEATRVLSIARHPSRSTASLSDSERGS